jgi:hypothetical protein
MNSSHNITSEAEVVHSLKSHLTTIGIGGSSVSSIIVDSDGSYTNSRYRASLEPMASLRINGYRIDTICGIRLGNQPFVCGFEVKHRFEEWRQGVSQAANYRSAVHQAYLAIPMDAKKSTNDLERQARQLGVGVLLRDDKRWHEAVLPEEPRPLPNKLDITQRLLVGVPLARRLQLNHPLNYLVVAHLRALYRSDSLEPLLATHWSDLGSQGTRRHAIDGAQSLGLIDMDGQLTVDGSIVADLLREMRFSTDHAINKRARLADVAPQLAVVARVCLLRQPAVRLVLEALQRASASGLGIGQLIAKARDRDRLLSDALFLSNPDLDKIDCLRSADYNASTVFKFKQVMWHAGILSTKAHASSGGKREEYAPENDIWRLDERIVSTRH